MLRFFPRKQLLPNPLACLLLICFLGVSGPFGHAFDNMAADKILQDIDIEGGVVVVVGCDDAQLLAKLSSRPTFLVHALNSSQTTVDRLRKDLLAAGEYGRVSVATFDGKRLPYVDNGWVDEDADPMKQFRRFIGLDKKKSEDEGKKKK